MKKTCKNPKCNTGIELKKKTQKYCSKNCHYSDRDVKGEKNPAWRGGRILLKNGYYAIHSPHHPFAAKGKNPWVYEHRLVVEKYLGRFLLREEQVHHVNHNKTDNRIENLVVLSASEHTKLHWELKKDAIISKGKFNKEK